MPEPTVLILLGVLAKVGAIISATTDVLNMRRGRSTELKEDERKRIQESAAAQPAPPKASATEEGNVISPVILQAAVRKIEKEVNAYAAAYDDDRITYPQADEQLRTFTARICSTLKTILDRNNGKFPDKQIEDYWKSFKCT